MNDWDALIVVIGRHYPYVAGYDRDDMLQEGRIAAWLAEQSHDPQRLPLKTWVGIHVAARFRDLLKYSRAACRGERTLTYEEQRDTRPAADVVELHERTDKLLRDLQQLTPTEYRAVLGVAAGWRYAELGDPKAVDNAVQRARTNLRAA